ncbi:MAG: Lrp/AsnC family transcriptional regulator [Rhizobiaceae bacterium]
MSEISAFDRRLLSALKKNGRESITNLSLELGVARATVQTRMERLIATGIIQRFTVELDAGGEEDIIRATMMVELQGNLARSVIRKLKKMPELVTLHTTNGAWDLIATIETSTLPEFDRILGQVREIDGVLNSETCILLSTAKG